MSTKTAFVKNSHDFPATSTAQVLDLEKFRVQRNVELRLQELECENGALNYICSNLITAIDGLKRRSRSRS